jgi:hypothetical protein
MNLKSITELRAKCWNAIAELRKLQSRAPWSGYTTRIVNLIDGHYCVDGTPVADFGAAVARVKEVLG